MQNQFMKNIYRAEIKRAMNRELIWQHDCPDDIKDVIHTKVNFGRYRGHTYEYIVNTDPRYITKLSYCQIPSQVPSQVKDFALEHVKFRITYYMPLKGDIKLLIKKYMERTVTPSTYGDNYSKHEMM